MSLSLSAIFPARIAGLATVGMVVATLSLIGATSSFANPYPVSSTPSVTTPQATSMSPDGHNWND